MTRQLLNLVIEPSIGLTMTNTVVIFLMHGYLILNGIIMILFALDMVVVLLAGVY